jgi:hypothetical protein
MAKYPVLTPGGSGGDEGEKKRRARQRRASKRKQAIAKVMSKAKDRKENIKQLGRDIVKTRDKMVEHPVGQAATLLAGRGRGRPMPKGRAAPKLGTRKLPKFDPKKKTGKKARRPGTAAERAKQRDQDWWRYTEGGPGTFKLKKKAKAPAKGKTTTKAQRLESRQKMEDRINNAVDSFHAEGTLFGPLKGKGPTLPSQVKAKGRRTKMTRSRKGKLPLMGVKPPKPKKTNNPTLGTEKTTVFRPMKKGEVDAGAHYAKRSLEDAKSLGGKYDRELKVYNKHSREGRDALRGSMIRRRRKKLLRKKKNVEAFDRGERVWQKGIKFSGPKAPSKKPATAPTKAKGKPHRGEKAPGGAHLGGPKVKISKGAQVKKDSWKRPPKGQSKRMRGKISKSDIENRIGPVMPGSAHFGKLSPKEFAAYRKSLEGMSRSEVLKAIKKRPSLTRAQKAVLLATAATAIAAEKKRRTAKPKKSGWPERSKYKKVAPDFLKPYAIEEVVKPIKKKRRKETAAQKNKRLNIRFKSAGQRQAEKYPSKEK